MILPVHSIEPCVEILVFLPGVCFEFSITGGEGTVRVTWKNALKGKRELGVVGGFTDRRTACTQVPLTSRAAADFFDFFPFFHDGGWDYHG